MLGGETTAQHIVLGANASLGSKCGKVPARGTLHDFFSAMTQLSGGKPLFVCARPALLGYDRGVFNLCCNTSDFPFTLGVLACFTNDS
ncbi:hypothetical protein Poly41_17380 [Novipirellula artificiosorum]|uniref:Uncharacterized protein n=1 Tax=Novipirellula artificiosorum TaxID=2528016 RepID=A0A5C6DU58_9BACT|nr:hypothetical protein Poly41_17380 [Novipirellula artificiosorum]